MTKIQHKRSSVLSSGSAQAPTTSQLDYGEIAINYNTSDPQLYIKDSSGAVISILNSYAPLAGATFTGDVNFDGEAVIKGDATNSGALTLNSETNAKYVKLQAPANAALTSYTLTLPGDDGSSGNVLTTDGSGGLSWALSSMSNADAAKLAGIAAGAEVNVNADWTASSGDAEILNKPTNVSAFTNDAGYITSADGGNAQTLDNLDSTQFLRSDVADSISGALNINGGTGNGSNDATLFVTATNNNDWGLIVDKYNGSATEYGVRIDVSSSANLALRVMGNNSEVFNIKGNGDISKVTSIYASQWFRNTISGNGLYNQATGAHFYSDADQTWNLTGNTQDQATSLKFRGTHNGNIEAWLYAEGNGWFGSLNTGGEWQLKTYNVDGYSPSLWFQEDANGSWTGNPMSDVGKIEYHSDRFYIASGSNSSNVCVFRRAGTDVAYVSNTGEIYATSSNHKVWHPGNDGAGSGLDADTLDGVQGSSYLRSDVNDTHNATFHVKELQFFGVGSNSGNSGSSYAIYQEGGGWSHPYPDLMIGYHTGIKLGANSSYNGIRFYSDSLNGSQVMTVNDSSTGLGANNVYVNNSLQAGSSLRAPIFYDSNDTNYYIDANNYSYVKYIGRRAHQTGFLVGSYNNVGNNSYYSNPIYAIGSSYMPGSSSLSSFHGVGYTLAANASFISLTGVSDWGFYVAASGTAKVFLDGGSGNISATGNITAYASDQRLKTNITPIKNALEKVSQINGVEYDWIDECQDEYEFSPTQKHEVGVIAQEIQKVLPEVVMTAPFNGNYTAKTGWKIIKERLQSEENIAAKAENREPVEITKAVAKDKFEELPLKEREAMCTDHNFLTVNYERITPLLIEAIKELSVRLTSLESQS